jgi:hypothetical protein
MTDEPSREELIAEAERLRARVVQLEAELAAVTGSMRMPSQQQADDEFRMDHDLPPSTPR